MSRSSWKGYHIDNSVYKYLSKKKKDKRKGNKQKDQKIQIWSRQSTILKSFVGKTVWIHTGQIFVKKVINKDMIGHKFGEIAFTRKLFHFRKTKKK